jgi:hypothetical protein
MKKQVLRKVLRRLFVSFFTLQSILMEAEAVINDRPIYDSSDIAGDEALTPAHLPYGRQITTLPDSYVTMETSTCGAMGNVASITKSARTQQMLKNNFRNCWKKEYLTALREHRRMT